MFKNIDGGGMIVTSEDSIALYRMLSLKAMLSLELSGMKRRGRSIYSVIKNEFNMKGNKQSVYDQFCKLIEEKKIAHNNGA